MGLAIVKSSWQRQTRYFGHDRRDEYSVLIFDNRGVGESDKPYSRYSTHEMARDAVELMDHVGWTEERQINLVGISLGGMISQEIACLIPTRLQSLSLLSTTASIENTKSFSATVLERLSLLIPKTAEQLAIDTASKIFAPEWLHAPDSDDPPSPKTTPKLGPAPGTEDGAYLRFESNFQRFQAQDLAVRALTGYITIHGIILQVIAAGWHKKSPEQLRAMADKLGRERIMVLHGTSDNMITLPNGLTLIEILEPGTAEITEGLGHAPVMERSQWFNDLLDEKLKMWRKLDE